MREKWHGQKPHGQFEWQVAAVNRALTVSKVD